MKISHIRSLLVAAVLAMTAVSLTAMQTSDVGVQSGEPVDVCVQTDEQVDEKALVLELELYDKLNKEVIQLMLDIDNISTWNYASEDSNVGVRATEYGDRCRLVGKFGQVIQELVNLNDEHCGKLTKKLDFILKHLQKKCSHCFPSLADESLKNKNKQAHRDGLCLGCNRIGLLLNKIENLRKYKELT